MSLSKTIPKNAPTANPAAYNAKLSKKISLTMCFLSIPRTLYRPNCFFWFFSTKLFAYRRKIPANRAVTPFPVVSTMQRRDAPLKASAFVTLSKISGFELSDVRM